MKKVCTGMLIVILFLSIPLAAGDFTEMLNKARRLQQEGDIQASMDLMKKIVEQYPDSPEAQFQVGIAAGELAQTSGEKGDFTTAMSTVNMAFDAYAKTIELDPDNVQAYFYYGVYGINVPEFFGKLDSGVEHLEKAAQLISRNPDADKDFSAAVYRYLGDGCKKQNRLIEAKIAWEQVLSVTPEGEHAAAATASLKNLGDIPESPSGQLSPKEGDSEEVTGLKKKLTEDTDNLQLWMKLGHVYLVEKNTADAVEAFKKATKIDPKSKDAQLQLVKALAADTDTGYNERIYDDQNTRTNLAFESVHEMEKALKLDPDNLDLRYQYGSWCVFMPFFVGRIDKGIAILEEIAADDSVPDSIRTNAIYTLGYAYRKKGNAVWMKLVTKYPKTEAARAVYDEYGLREYGTEKAKMDGEKVLVQFHMGFQDELEPQTAVWIEDKDGNHIKTLYVSGFSGFAKEKQVVLPHFAEQTAFETDGTTGASIDWGKHTYAWDLTDHEGNKVKKGTYKVVVEISWWPSMKYGLASAEIKVGGKENKVVVSKKPFIPWMKVKYEKK